MVKISVTVFLLFLFITASFSQELYSKENLEKASSQDLFLYLTKAQKLRKAGGVLLIAAPISATTGVLLSKHAWSGGTQGEWVVGAGEDLE